jgi:hypothetical protein
MRAYSNIGAPRAGPQCHPTTGVLAGVDDVRTLKKRRLTKKAFHQFVDQVLIALNADPRRDHILENIMKLQQSFDPKIEGRKAA